VLNQAQVVGERENEDARTGARGSQSESRNSPEGGAQGGGGDGKVEGGALSHDCTPSDCMREFETEREQNMASIGVGQGLRVPSPTNIPAEAVEACQEGDEEEGEEKESESKEAATARGEGGAEEEKAVMIARVNSGGNTNIDTVAAMEVLLGHPNS